MYIGNWSNNKMNGYGIFIWPDKMNRCQIVPTEVHLAERHVETAIV
ncbi:MAG: MORN repeat-containing protein [Salinivirgaceae bacterium]|nr:MORN repeat-containing protein [Salinivirgaceae bacterium]